jgi:hypothetical protein
MSDLRESRLELDAPLRHPLPLTESQALVDLLSGRLPARPPTHPLFRHPDAAALLVGESLDHATGGSRILQDAGGGLRLAASASLQPCPALLSAGLDWLGGLLALETGDVPGFIVPPGGGRHDLRLLAWDGARLRPLAALPEPVVPGRASMTAFIAAAGLPDATAPDAEQRAWLKRVALAQLQGRSLPVAQAKLDGAWQDGAGLFRCWMAGVLARLDGLSTASVHVLQPAW